MRAAAPELVGVAQLVSPPDHNDDPVRADHHDHNGGDDINILDDEQLELYDLYNPEHVIHVHYDRADYDFDDGGDDINNLNDPCPHFDDDGGFHEHDDGCPAVHHDDAAAVPGGRDVHDQPDRRDDHDHLHGAGYDHDHHDPADIDQHLDKLDNDDDRARHHDDGSADDLDHAARLYHDKFGAWPDHLIDGAGEHHDFGVPDERGPDHHDAP